MNMHQKSIDICHKHFKDVSDRLMRVHGEGVTESVAISMYEQAQAELRSAVDLGNYAAAHSALWSVMVAKAHVDAVRYGPTLYPVRRDCEETA